MEEGRPDDGFVINGVEDVLGEDVDVMNNQDQFRYVDSYKAAASSMKTRCKLIMGSPCHRICIYHHCH